MKTRKAITDDGSLPTATGTSLPIGTILIGHPMHRIRITGIHQYFIIRTLGSLATTVHTMDTTAATIRITDTIEATPPIRMSIDGITAAVGMFRSRGVLILTETIGEVKTDVHEVHGV